MQSIQRAGAITGTIGALLCGLATIHAQVNGNATISAPSPVFGQPLTVSTSSQFAGAISSIRWAGKEFINNWDHGRQMAPNFQFFNLFECYNPYEAGSEEDQNFPTTSSRLLTLTASGNTLDSTTQMAWYLSTREPRPGFGDLCGDPKDWLPCPPYTGPLSDYRVHKTVTIGFAGIPNVIEYLTELYIPEQIQKGINNVTAVMPYEFSTVWSYDVVSKDYRNMRGLAGEDDRIKVISTADRSYAMGFYAPELLQPYSNGGIGTANFWFVVPPNPFYPDPHNPNLPDPDFACVHVGSVNRYDSFNGPGYSNDRAYLVIGSLDQVRSTLSNLHYQFRALDPDVYDRRDYLAINGLESVLSTQQAAETHWQTQGIAQGLRASKTFSASQYLQLNPDVANAYGATNYQGAIDHYISSGRSEGRSTVAKPAGGMQHLLVFTNRIVNASGQNAYGQLGTSTSPSPPTHIFSLDNTVTEVAAGDYTSFAVKNDGSLWVWGSNQYGARGDGTSGDNIASPVQVPIPNRITTPSRRGKHAVAVGAGVYAVLDTEGQVWTWGVNWNGRLGNGTTTARYTPARVQKSANPNDYLTGVVSIAAGGGTMAAVDADGTVWTWGAGANGALGNGFTKDSSYPVQVMKAGDNNQGIPLTGMTEVACGSSGFCIALARYGTVFGWGSNAFSQLGLPAGGALSIATPIDLGPGNFIDAIAAGAAHCIAHSQGGNVYGWGYNGRGQLGTGSTGVAQSPPVVMKAGPDGMNDISDLAAGGNFSVMIRNSDRAAFVTGDNQSGQLATPGNQSTQSLPVRSSF
jgi:alpha-tubulin suppressor-like RCC1 family protein